jgi:nucleotidyltransferase/DNA polymerase involved in DNA repair
MQLNMNLNVPTNTKNAWAFAVDLTRSQSVFKPRKFSKEKAQGLSACVISAVSREAKALGVRVGMKYQEAKQLVPELRILITNR